MDWFAGNEASVVFALKKGLYDAYNNYRGICLLSVFFLSYYPSLYSGGCKELVKNNS